MSLYTTFIHWSAIIVAPGYSDPIKFEDGNPYGYSGTANEFDETGKKSVAHQMWTGWRRMAPTAMLKLRPR